MNILLSKMLRRTLWVGAMLAVYGCAQLAPPTPRVEIREPNASRPTTGALAMAGVHNAPSADGSVFQSGQYRGLFEDRRARLAGDVITIQIQEKTSAKVSNATSLARTGKTSGGVTALPVIPSSVTSRLSVGASSDNSFDSKGDTGADNEFTGTITVTVIEVLSNGNLVVSGEKQIGINQNVEVMRFSGVINPALILPGNVINSTQVADARLESRGRGDIDRAQTTGWLQRFFLSWLPI